ncbi:SAM-dependent methyltransferase [Streptomyces triticagri]|uniref:SAM-dependent methyltransferase n=1 Tax=Streptomyces triticagri TaxID=2293568 RepID=A0A372M197_9ACTN|nr:SAM-dependent methyltransferase [Streptomyces triticagri]RFU84599.1 SAM-dependent methyltransferase [Streptomyces triticagri]
MTGSERPVIDTGKAHSARVYDWFLDGKDNYPVDEELARQILAIEPQAKRSAQHNRWFMRRATRRLARDMGVRQFLDIGTGIPTEPNLHRIAQDVAPESRVVYADNDPIVLAHAAALLRGTAEGVTEYVQADVREPAAILQQAGAVLDFERPVALSVIALMHFVADGDGAFDVIGTLVDALAPGSFLVLSQLTAEFNPEAVNSSVRTYGAGGVTLVPRSREEVGRFFGGLELLEPGIVPVDAWHRSDDEGGSGPEREGAATGGPVPLYAGVGRKP